MLCGFLILAIVSFNAKCNECCSSYRCGLFDDETRCNEGGYYTCKWKDGVCVEKVCADYEVGNCAGDHYTGIINGAPTDIIYCKWTGSACADGTNACEDYNNDGYACNSTGKCFYDGTSTTCKSASSCDNFTEGISCHNYNVSNARCYFDQDDNKCKVFSCSSFGQDTCYDERGCVYTGGACTAFSSCSALTDADQCNAATDTNGSECFYTGTQCKVFACSDLKILAACSDWPNQCAWFTEGGGRCDIGSIDGCPGQVPPECTGGCHYLTSCPAGTGSAHAVYVPALFVALVFVAFLL